MESKGKGKDIADQALKDP